MITGCVNETLSAHEARQLSRAASTRNLRELWTRIADDEARHAALAWEVLAWMLARSSRRECTPWLARETNATYLQRMTNDEAPGWDAIQAVFEARYPSATPLHSGVRRDRSGDASIAVQAWRGEEVWHLTTLGLSELWDKESESTEVSGWGMEITMLLPREGDEKRLPTWPITLLRGLADMIDQTKLIQEPGNRVNLQRSINAHSSGQEDGQLTALMWALEDRLGEQGEIDTPNGRLRFLRAVGISSEELTQPEAQLSATLASLDPPNITDPSRLSR